MPEQGAKAVDVTNDIFSESGGEGVAIATGLKKPVEMLSVIPKKQTMSKNK